MLNKNRNDVDGQKMSR